MLRTCSRRTGPVRAFLPLLLLFLRITAQVSGQEASASITGTVVDPLGARVAGAGVKLLRDREVSRATTTDLRGDFSFDALPEGRYRIQASADGFQVRTTSQIFLPAGARRSVDVSLPLGPLETDVTVTAAASERDDSLRTTSECA